MRLLAKRGIQSRWSSPVPFLAILLIVSQLGLNSCSQAAEQEFDPSSIVLHMDYRSGGDAPLGFLMSFFEDGRVRFLSPRWKVAWSQLSKVESQHLQAALQSPEFLRSVEIQIEEGPQFACCDAHEVGIFLGPEATPASVWFNSSEPPPPKRLYELVQFVNRVGKEHFGRRFSIPMPHERIEPPTAGEGLLCPQEALRLARL